MWQEEYKLTKVFMNRNLLAWQRERRDTRRKLPVQDPNSFLSSSLSHFHARDEAEVYNIHCILYISTVSVDHPQGLSQNITFLPACAVQDAIFL